MYLLKAGAAGMLSGAVLQATSKLSELTGAEAKGTGPKE